MNQAEKLHRKSLVIGEKFGRLEGMASAYGDLLARRCRVEYAV